MQQSSSAKASLRKLRLGSGAVTAAQVGPGSADMIDPMAQLDAELTQVD